MQKLSQLRRDHPVFFWGVITLLAGLLVATAVVGWRVPQYQREIVALDQMMSEQERAVRDEILDSRARRSELAIAMLQREVRLKAAEQRGLHLAISVEDSVLYLRHGPATLRQIPVRIGADTLIQAADGRTWRIVRPLGERRIEEKQTSPTYEVPEWVFLAHGQAPPPESERAVAGALGRYVLRLNDGTEIYSEPSAGPLAGTVKPGGFMVPEPEFRAIFEAVRRELPVYIY
jgi:hypothetical protein